MSTTPTIPVAAGGGAMAKPDPRRQIHFATDGIAPPAPLYIGVDDTLLLQVQNSAAGITVQCLRRYLAPDGSIVPHLDQMTPTTDRTNNNLFMPQQEGFLLAVTVSINGTARRGQTFCTVVLIRGQGTTQLILPHILIQGYVDSLSRLAYPNGTQISSTDGRGVIRSITGTAPGVGVDIGETVPTSVRWVLNTFRFGFTASATVANRTSRLIIDDGANTLFFIDPARLVTAAQTFNFNYGGTLPFRQSPNNVDDIYGPPVPLVLLPGYRIRTTTGFLQAGDQYTAPQYQVEEWISV